MYFYYFGRVTNGRARCIRGVHLLVQVCNGVGSSRVRVGKAIAWVNCLLSGTIHWHLIEMLLLMRGDGRWIIPGFHPDLRSGLRSGLRCRRRVWMNERRIHHHSWSCARTVVVVVGWLDFMIFGRLIKLV